MAEFVLVAGANAVDVDDAVPTVNDTEGDEAEADMAAAAPTNDKSFIVVVAIVCAHNNAYRTILLPLLAGKDGSSPLNKSLACGGCTGVGRIPQWMRRHRNLRLSTEATNGIDSFLEKKDGRKRSSVGWKEGRECDLAIASDISLNIIVQQALVLSPKIKASIFQMVIAS